MNLLTILALQIVKAVPQIRNQHIRDSSTQLYNPHSSIQLNHLVKEE